MSTGMFQSLVVIGIYVGSFCVLWSLHDIARLLAAIFRQMTGQWNMMWNDADFHDRGDRGKEPR